MNHILQNTQQLKELQLQKTGQMTDHYRFKFMPEKDIKIVIFKTDSGLMGAVLIGCWLFDCRNRYPLYVHSSSQEVLQVVNARRVIFLKKDGEIKKKFERLLNEFDYMSYGCMS